MSSLFVKATKAEAKARIAITGPSGAGKTDTALQWATVLSDGGKIAVIDTERDSAKLYADRYDFDTLSMSAPYHPNRVVDALADAEQAGYAVVIIDSLTHFWSGQGGILEIVDQAGQVAKGNNFAGWKIATPIQQRMVDAILAFNGHVIVTMRSKTEYSLEKDERGRTVPKKVGMAPQQRDGLEYEFTLLLEMDIEHRTIVGKTRCDLLTDKVYAPGHSKEGAEVFMNWLRSGDPLINANEHDMLSGRIRSLNPSQKNALKTAFAEVQMPKIASLPKSRLAEANALIDQVESTTFDSDAGAEEDTSGSDAS